MWFWQSLCAQTECSTRKPYDHLSSMTLWLSPQTQAFCFVFCLASLERIQLWRQNLKWQPNDTYTIAGTRNPHNLFLWLVALMLSTPSTPFWSLFSRRLHSNLYPYTLWWFVPSKLTTPIKGSLATTSPLWLVACLSADLLALVPVSKPSPGQLLRLTWLRLNHMVTLLISCKAFPN